MTAIDVGPGAVNGPDSSTTTTRMSVLNPANDTGTLDTMELWFAVSGNNVKCGTFYGSGTSWTNRDYESIGTVSSGSKRTFTGLSCDVSANDILGAYWSSGSIEISYSGSNGLFKSGDQFGAGTQTYSTTMNIPSLYATGATAANPDISNNSNAYSFGTVAENSETASGLTQFTVTNNSAFAVNITIGATDMTGGTTWTLSDSATPDVNTYGLKAGLNGGDYTIVVKKNAAFNTLKSGLAASGTQQWGLKLYAPTGITDGTTKTAVVTLYAAAA